jgi:2,3-dihydroxyphenylpropionate 1,2-dioxygenase
MSTSSFVAAASHAPGMNAPGAETLGLTFRAALIDLAEAVKEYDPELVICFGSDHRRAFREIIPTFSTIWKADSLGDYGSPTGAFSIDEDVARSLTEQLIARDFDMSVAYDVTLDHGFSQTLHQIFGDLQSVPLVPIFINCATEPIPTVARTIAFGEAIGAILNGLNRRVLYVASGGLSHTPPTLDATTRAPSDEYRRELFDRYLEESMTKIIPDWDERALSAFEGEVDVAAQFSDEFLKAGGTGAPEVLNWIAAWAAAGRAPLKKVAYEAVSSWSTGLGVMHTA